MYHSCVFRIMMLIQLTGLIIVLKKTDISVIKQVQNAEASQTGDPENVSNAIEQSADFKECKI